jgi:hypothetical protein
MRVACALRRLHLNHPHTSVCGNSGSFKTPKNQKVESVFVALDRKMTDLNVSVIQPSRLSDSRDDGEKTHVHFYINGKGAFGGGESTAWYPWIIVGNPDDDPMKGIGKLQLYNPK